LYIYLIVFPLQSLQSHHVCNCILHI
jgi:hypothetical protein